MSAHKASEIELAPPIGAHAGADRQTNTGLTGASSYDAPRVSSQGSSTDGNTLNEKGLAVPEDEGGLKRSNNSSFVGELGGPGHVSVRRGKEEFAALERRFSNLSQRSGDLQRFNSRRSARSASGFHQPAKVLSASSGPDPSDAEKGKAGEDEFDLAEVLRSGREKSDEAGIKRKQVGVVWEDLEVVGAGGLKINIRNFSNAVMEQFMVSIVQVAKLIPDARHQTPRRCWCRPFRVQAEDNSQQNFRFAQAWRDVLGPRTSRIRMLDFLEKHHQSA